MIDRLDYYAEELAIISQWRSNYGDKQRIMEQWQLANKATADYEQAITDWAQWKGQWPNWYGRWSQACLFTRCTWDAVDTVVRVDWISFETKMQQMKNIRRLIGDEMYFSGTLPPIFPVGFPIVPRIREVHKAE